MGIITLTSDWGLTDYYIAAVKGAILSKMPSAQIVDITHNIKPFCIEEAGFILNNCYKSFPDGTVHILAVNTEEDDDNKHTIVKCDNQFFIGNDNGLFSLILDREPDKIISFQTINDLKCNSFITRDKFVKAATHLANGNPLEALGSPKTELRQIRFPQPIVSEEFIKGTVIYVDHYENLITNIPMKLFHDIRKERKFQIVYGRNFTDKISLNYNEVHDGELVALFASHGNLELALNRGNASGLLGGGVNEKVLVEFYRK
ncbi:MAG: S-adenosyl-l-methionine hydroxide adenosyltransferase family protein [Hyphomicrobiales bacterium]